MNTVTKSGGNRFSGQGAFYYEGNDLQSNNIDDDLRARGVTAPARRSTICYDVTGNFGGPIKRDKIWFFGAGRRYAVTPKVLNCTLPDGSACVDGVTLPNVTGKVTPRSIRRTGSWPSTTAARFTGPTVRSASS